MTDQPQANKSLMGRSTMRTVVIIVFIMTMLIMMVIISSSVYLMVRYPEAQLPSALKEWSSMCLGFLFGGLFSLIREAMTD